MQCLGRLPNLNRKIKERWLARGNRISTQQLLNKIKDENTNTISKRRSGLVETRRSYGGRNRNEGDLIVITGISGKFANADNMQELKHNLLEGVDMIGPNLPWTLFHPMIPSRMGRLKNPDKFDADFFGVPHKTADALDPQTRQLLEVCYEAIFDAGINPATLRGTRTGLYIGMAGGEGLDSWLCEGPDDALDGHVSLGGTNFMAPGRVSYLFDFTGQSVAVSTGCSSSVVALEAAVHAIIRGSCERALVTGTTMQMRAVETIEFGATGALSSDGMSRPFDAKANGFVRSEAIVAMLIQKRRDAKREYATVHAVQTGHDGYKPEGITFPSSNSQQSLIKELYTAAGIDPADITYVEAHGTGTPAGDSQELLSIHESIAKAPNRKEKLLVGSVKSNLGHPESVSGLVSIAKLIIANETGVIPANLNFETPNPLAAAAFDGSLEIVSSPKPWKGGLVGISSYGIGGSSAHMILEFPLVESSKLKENFCPSPTEIALPILLPFAGRTPELTQASLAEICEGPGKNPEAANLIRQVFRTNAPGQDYRGFGIISRGDAKPTIEVDGKRFDSSFKRPLWFVFPGMGAQWNEMGREMMHIDAYAESIRRTEVTLKNTGVDLQHLLRPNNASIFSNIKDAFVVIGAVQIALLDTLKSLGLEPEGFLGHSAGEVICAYADDCFNAEQTILVAHARGRAVEETLQSQGGMAAVGLSWEEAVRKCPPEIDVACHNSNENVSISGPMEEIKKCMESFQSQGIFVREVNTCGFAPHSRFAQLAHASIVKYIEEIVGQGKPRTSRWISTSIPEAQWDTELARAASPQYYGNNIVKPVLFHEAVQKIPENAIVVEVGPRGVLLPLLRSSLHPNCSIFAPMHHTVEDKLTFFLSTIGKMYNQGLDLNIGNLYPTVSLPVRSTTPNLSTLVKWNHEQSWNVPIIKNYKAIIGYKAKIDVSDGKDAYLLGHKLDSRCVYPGMGHVVHAWKGYAAAAGVDFQKAPIALENISFDQATFLKEGKAVTLSYHNLKGTNKFVIEDENVAVAKGSIVSPEDVSTKLFELEPVRIPDTSLPNSSSRRSLKTLDIYKEFRLRGYNYSGDFEGIRVLDNLGNWALVAWRGNWVSFLDTLLQLTLPNWATRNTLVPRRLESCVIDPITFLSYIQSLQENERCEKSSHASKSETLIPVSIYHSLGVVKCPGIELRGPTTAVIPREKQKQFLSLNEYHFTPFFETKDKCADNLASSATLASFVDLVLENKSASKLKMLDIFADVSNSMSEIAWSVCSRLPNRRMELTLMSTAEQLGRVDENVLQYTEHVISKESISQLLPDSGAVDLVCSDQPALLPQIALTLQSNSYLILRSDAPCTEILPEQSLQLLSQKKFDNFSLQLFKKATDTQALPPLALRVDDEAFGWVPELKSMMKDLASEVNKGKSDTRLFLYSQGDPQSGIVGLVKCLRKETGGEQLRCIFDPDQTLQLDFANPSEELRKIIAQDLVMNVVKNGQLGSYRHVPKVDNINAHSKHVEHAFINTLTAGDLSSLRWIESPLKFGQHSPEADKLCSVHFAALNFRDVMLATGKLAVDSESASGPQDCVMGFEYSGVNSKGERVMGILNGKGLASTVVANDVWTWKFPEHWTLEDAATVPMVYSTAYYAMLGRGRMRRGNSILIHSGTGGVGQAAINIALDLQCEIFTTVGTDEKRERIKQLFPSLKDENIGNSRDCSFEKLIKEATDGLGVDVVLNSLADDKLQASVRCLKVNGKFLEIGAFDASQNSRLGMSCFLKNIEFHGVFLNQLFAAGQKEEQEIVKRYIDDGLERGVIKPLPRNVFPKHQIEEAFKYMARGRHMGKILIQVQKEDVLAEREPVHSIPRSYFHSHKSYIIIGGLGGLGLEVANWLVDRGARHLVLVSRSGMTTGYQDYCARKWEERGVKVETPQTDVSAYEAAEALLKRLTAGGKQVGGIFNSGVVLRDGPIEEQSIQDFQEVAAPKVQATKNLDELSRKYCKQGLDYFVVFSSISCGHGNACQSNYGLANSVMEQVCERRKEAGLHGLAIQWGVIGEVGLVAEKIFGVKYTGEESFQGLLPQRISSCLDVLDLALQQEATTLASFLVAEDTHNKSKKAGIVESIVHIFGVSHTNIPPTKRLIELGMDSLIGIEVKQLMERDYDASFTIDEIRAMSVGDLLSIEAGTFDKNQAKSSEESQTSGTNVTSDFIEIMRGGRETLVELKSGAEGKDASNLFIIHGAEGHSSSFKHLARLLESRVFAYQFNVDAESEVTVQDVAHRYVQSLKEVQPNGPYNIVCFSAGTAIAFEMELILKNEHNDKVTNVFVLDGFCCMTDILAEDQRTKAYQSAIDVWIRTLNVSQAEHSALVKSLELGNREEVVRFCIEFMCTKLPEVDPTLINSYIMRVYTFDSVISSYKPSEKIDASITLIKATEKTDFMAYIKDERHYLQKYCNQPVTVYPVDANHVNMLRSNKVPEQAKIINGILAASKAIPSL